MLPCIICPMRAQHHLWLWSICHSNQTNWYMPNKVKCCPVILPSDSCCQKRFVIKTINNKYKAVVYAQRKKILKITISAYM